MTFFKFWNILKVHQWNNSSAYLLLFYSVNFEKLRLWANFQFLQFLEIIDTFSQRFKRSVKFSTEPFYELSYHAVICSSMIRNRWKSPWMINQQSNAMSNDPQLSWKLKVKPRKFMIGKMNSWERALIVNMMFGFFDLFQLKPVTMLSVKEKSFSSEKGTTGFSAI